MQEAYLAALSEVPKVMYIITKERHFKYVNEAGCVLPEKTYPISGNLKFEPNDMG